MIARVPVERRDRMPLLDPGIVEDTLQAIEQRLAPSEQFARGGFCFRLRDHIWRNGGRQTEESNWAQCGCVFLCQGRNRPKMEVRCESFDCTLQHSPS